MSIEQEGRREFMGIALGAVAAIGGGASLVGMKQSWDPLPSVRAAGFTTVDMSSVVAGELYTSVWRGKPIFILKKTDDMEVVADREVTVDGARYSIMIGLCTHLGCIPAYKKGDNKFKCACHGGEFDAAGRQTFGPPPRPFDIPPFDIQGTKLVLGQQGEAYKKLVNA
jgi:ubiquinol-cytochrome c reductase iron-sulfur subunit